MSSLARKCYGVRHDLKSCICLNWIECRTRTNGIKGATQKSFQSVEDAKQWILEKYPTLVSIPIVGETPALKKDIPSLCKEPNWEKSIDWDWKNSKFYHIRNDRKDVSKTLPCLLEQIQSKTIDQQLTTMITPYCLTEEEKKSSCFIFTDGSCPLNPGPSASAFCMLLDQTWIFANQYWKLETYPWKISTNNTGEVGSVLITLHYLLSRPSPNAFPEQVCFFLDSQISLNWIRSMFGHRTSRKELKSVCPVFEVNQDILQDVFSQFKKCPAETLFYFRKVRGHSNVVLNNCADLLSFAALPSALWKRK